MIFHLVLANLAGAAAILVVLALRGPARAQFGAGLAYALWLTVPAAMLASLLPARTILLPTPNVTPGQVIALMQGGIATSATPIRPVQEATLDMMQILIGVWLTGVVASLMLLAIGQRRALARFGRITADASDARLARASNPSVGPALIGVVRPRIVVPNDFEARFQADERAMILAHERAHLAHGHASINGLAALLKAVNWFNPLVHVAARCARIDQELACDAAVVGRFPDARQTYARAMLKTQLAFLPLPLGCDWPARSPSLLEKRIEMLAQQKPGRVRQLGGAVIIAALAAGAGLAAWSAEPADVRVMANPVRDGALPQSAPTSAVAPLSDEGANRKEPAPRSQNQVSAVQRPTVAAGYGPAAPNVATVAQASDAQTPAAAAASPLAPPPVGAPAPGATNQSDAVMLNYGITADDLQQRVRLLMFVRGVQPTGQALYQMKMDAFSGLVDEHLKMQEMQRVQTLLKQHAQDAGFMPSDREVDDDVAGMAKQNNLTYDELKAKFAAAGIDLNTLREQVRIGIGWQRLMGGIGPRPPGPSAAGTSGLPGG